VRARYSAPVQTGSGAHPASYTMGVDQPPPYHAPRLKKDRVIPLLPLRAFLVCSMVNFTFSFTPTSSEYSIWNLKREILLNSIKNISSYLTKTFHLFITKIRNAVVVWGNNGCLFREKHISSAMCGFTFALRRTIHGVSLQLIGFTYKIFAAAAYSILCRERQWRLRMMSSLNVIMLYVTQ
jgi:hypothetical protein